MTGVISQTEVTAPDRLGRRAPTLWNPTVAALLSVPFTPIFGAYINYRNWAKLGLPELAETSRSWSIALLAIIIIGAGFFIYLPIEHPLVTNLHYLPNILSIVWYLLSGRRQVQYVKANYAGSYKRSSWAGPLLIATALYIAWIAVALLVGIVVMELRK